MYFWEFLSIIVYFVRLFGENDCALHNLKKYKMSFQVAFVDVFKMALLRSAVIFGMVVSTQMALLRSAAALVVAFATQIFTPPE